MLERLEAWGSRQAVTGDLGEASYGALCANRSDWIEFLAERQTEPRNQIVAFRGDFSPQSVSLLLALLEAGSIAVALPAGAGAQEADLLEISEAQCLVDCGRRSAHELLGPDEAARNPVYRRLGASSPGLVVFTSGATGRPKAILHDCNRLLEKFRVPRSSCRMLCFLALDHLGGVNTLLYTLSNGGTAVFVRDRQPSTVCRAIEEFGVEVLPTTPSFLNLMLLSGVYRDYDLSSLKLVTYGTEVMPPATLSRLRAELPRVRLQQTYGLSELGVLRSKSREDGSLWVKVGGEGYETEVRQGVLWIRAESSMLGYLNAPDPLDAEGWFNTDDAVEQDGEWLKFLGRKTDIINTAGLKVHPAEVESALLEMDNVLDVTVRGEPNALIGQAVVARFNLEEAESLGSLKGRVRSHCSGRLPRHMIPLRVEITDTPQYSTRHKRMRRSGGPDPGAEP